MKNLSLLFFFVCFQNSLLGNEVVLSKSNLEGELSILKNCEIYKSANVSLDYSKITKLPFEKITDEFNERKISDVIWLKTNLFNSSNQLLSLAFSHSPALFSDLFTFRNGKLIRLTAGSLSFLNGSKYGNEYYLDILPSERKTIYIRLVFDVLNHKNVNPNVKISLKENFIINHQVYQWSKSGLFCLYIATLSLLFFAFVYGIFQIKVRNDMILRYYILVVFLSFCMVIRVLEMNLQIKILPNNFYFINPFIYLLNVSLIGAYVLLFSKIYSKNLIYNSKKYFHYFSFIQGLFLIITLFLTINTLHNRKIDPHYFILIGVITIFNFLLTIIILYNIIKTKIELYEKYIIYGFIFSFIGYILMFFINRTQSFLSDNFWQVPSIFMCFGIILEIVFFMYALNLRTIEFEKIAVSKGQKIERTRIANELHDNLNGILASVRIGLQAHLGINENLSKKVLSLIGLVDKSIKEVKNISNNLLPIEIDQNGLINSIKTYLDSLKDVSTVKFKLKSEKTSDMKLSTEINYNLYNIFLETVENIQKHSKATDVEIELYCQGNILNFSILDNGIGFDKENIKYGMGLKNIQHRADIIGAKLDIFSEIGKGSIFNISLKI